MTDDRQPLTDPVALDLNTLIGEMQRVAALVPVEHMNRSEALAMIHLMQLIINRVNDFDDRHPAPLLTLRRGRRC